jgi:transposase
MPCQATGGRLRSNLPRGEKLRHHLAGHRHHRFGASSETIEQLQLALEAGEIAIAKMTAKLRLPDEEPDEEKNKPKRRPIPDHIPRVKVALTTGDADCAQCGGALRRLGEDVTEELEYLPGRFSAPRIVRPRMACTGCEAFTQASLPSGAPFSGIENALSGNGQAIAQQSAERGARSSAGAPAPACWPMSSLSAMQASPAGQRTNKCADHMPLYRQSQIFERDGLHLDRSTLADWVGKSTALLEPLAAAVRRPLLGH